MKLTMQVEHDDQLRQSVRDLIAGEVRHILRNELDGIVRAELTALRLSGRETSQLNEAVKKVVDAEIKRTALDIIKSEVRTRIESMFKTLRFDMESQINSALTKIGGK